MKKHIVDFKRFSMNEDEQMDGEIFYTDKWSMEEYEDVDHLLSRGVVDAVGFFDDWVAGGKKDFESLKDKFIYIACEGFPDERLIEAMQSEQGSSSGEYDFSYVEDGASIRSFNYRTIAKVFGMNFLMELVEAGEWSA
jgi:hypothetical protein